MLNNTLALLGFGLILGLKHATEIDHVIAVSTLVSEYRKLHRAILVGILWGVGHTASITVVGVMVLTLRVTIPPTVAGWLEFAVALMLILLGGSALIMALRRRTDVHVHQHSHDGISHIHLHFHEQGNEHNGPTRSHSHQLSRVGVKPLLVGAVHGMAGSAAVVLLVLTQIQSALLGFFYLIVFGIGTIIGMLTMSGLIGLPFALTSRRLSHLHSSLHTAAGALSILFGLWYAYETGIANGLWKTF